MPRLSHVLWLSPVSLFCSCYLRHIDEQWKWQEDQSCSQWNVNSTWVAPMLSWQTCCSSGSGWCPESCNWKWWGRSRFSLVFLACCMANVLVSLFCRCIGGSRVALEIARCSRIEWPDVRAIEPNGSSSQKRWPNHGKRHIQDMLRQSTPWNGLRVLLKVSSTMCIDYSNKRWMTNRWSSRLLMNRP